MVTKIRIAPDMKLRYMMAFSTTGRMFRYILKRISIDEGRLNILCKETYYYYTCIDTKWTVLEYDTRKHVFCSVFLRGLNKIIDSYETNSQMEFV